MKRIFFPDTGKDAALRLGAIAVLLLAFEFASQFLWFMLDDSHPTSATESFILAFSSFKWHVDKAYWCITRASNLTDIDPINPWRILYPALALGIFYIALFVRRSKHWWGYLLGILSSAALGVVASILLFPLCRFENWRILDWSSLVSTERAFGWSYGRTILFVLFPVEGSLIAVFFFASACLLLSFLLRPGVADAE